MTLVLAGVAVVSTAVAGGLLLISLYLVVLAVASLVARRQAPPPGGYSRRFAILVPAHNEEGLLGRLLANLNALSYPPECFDVHVVADNCSDATASIGRTFSGVEVHERVNDNERAKGFALRWLLDRLQARTDQSSAYDAYIVLDADSVVSTDFLIAMNARLAAGSQVIQAYYSVLNAQQSPVAALRYVALAAVHYVRPLGRSVFGLSCGLKGNGMCFEASVLSRFGWDWFTLAEDVEFHLALVNAGIRVDFAPEAHVLADMPVSLAQAASQNDRWERGRLQLARGAGWRLLLDGIRQRSSLKVDAAIEQLIPPLSVPFALGFGLLCVTLPLGLTLPASLAVAGLLGQLAYVVAGLLLVRASWGTYLALTYAPLYIAWKVGVYAQAFVTARSTSWVRTARSA
jgi:cellulose synthase/poly-beta-1,6-N-acetylglucosamine synthase-like glycosyltransferase